MQCPRCQHENPPQAKFCLECGGRLARQCGQCGTELPAILLTPETLALAKGFVQVMSCGSVPVKGLTASIEISELTGASPVRSRLHAAASRGLTRLVGRDAEIELLRQALGRAGEGHGSSSRW